MAPQLSAAEAGFIWGCYYMDSSLSYDAIADVVFSWRKNKERSRKGTAPDSTRPSKNTVGDVLNCETHDTVGKDISPKKLQKRVDKRGREPGMDAESKAKVPKLLDRVETEVSEGEVTLPLLTEEIGDMCEADGKPRPTPNTVRRCIEELDYVYRPVAKKIKLEQHHADDRKSFSEEHANKPNSFFEEQLVWEDEGGLLWNTSAGARRIVHE